MVPSKGRRRRRCRFCGEFFSPDPRLKGRHYACSAPECQSERRKRNRTRWLSRHPGYFSGRYLKTRAWLEAHPGYLKRYRLAHPEGVRVDNDRRRKRHLQAKTTRADMQVAKSLQAVLTRELTPVLAESRRADIQVSFLPQLIMVSLVSASYLERTRADIQDSIAPEHPGRYLPGHEPAEEIPPATRSSPRGAEVL